MSKTYVFHINPFYAIDLFWYPLKTLENLWFSNVFRVYQKRSVAWNWLKSKKIFCCQLTCVSIITWYKSVLLIKAVDRMCSEKKDCSAKFSDISDKVANRGHDLGCFLASCGASLFKRQYLKMVKQTQIIRG